jgi:hypothetical protein
MGKLAWFFLALVLIGCYARLYVGIDESDEPFFVALPYRFLLGDRPFLDETNLSQTAALISFPFLWVFHKLTGSIAGSLLFFRHLHFLTMGLTAIAVYRLVIRDRLPRENYSALPSLLFLLFIPHGLPSFGYYTLGCALFTLGRVVSLHFSGPRSALLIGLCDALASLAYLPLVIAAAFAALLRVWHEERPTWRWFGWYGVGVVGTLTLIFSFYHLDPSVFLDLSRQLHQSRFAHRDFLSLARAGSISLRLIEYLATPLYLGLCLLVPFLFRRRDWLPAFFVTPFVWWWINRTSGSGLGANGLIIHLMFLAPWVYWRMPQQPVWARAFVLIWVPSLVAGLVLATLSLRGLANAAIGFLPGAFITLVLLQARLAPLGRYAAVPTLLFLGGLFQMQIPRPIGSLTPIERGPFQGLFASPSRSAALSALGSDFPAVSAKRFLVIGPALTYLYSSQKPATANLWRACAFTEGVSCPDYYRARMGEIGFVVRFLKYESPITAFFERHCSRVSSRVDLGYEVLDCFGSQVSHDAT